MGLTGYGWVLIVLFLDEAAVGGYLSGCWLSLTST